MKSRIHTGSEMELMNSKDKITLVTGCVTNKVQSLRCESLQQRRYMDRLSMLFKIQHGLVDISPEFVQPGDSRTRGSQRIQQLEANKDVYRYSFYPRTISDWNRLPISFTNSQTILGLREALACLPPTLHLHGSNEAVHSFNQGRWGILSVFIMRRSFYTE